MPDLVSKLREALQPIVNELHILVDSLSCSEHARDSVRHRVLDEIAQFWHGVSLLGLEGQAASSVNPAWKDEALQSRINEAIDAAQEPCGPSQPETVREGYKGICVCGHRSGAHHESDPSCEFCACKSYRDVSAWGGSPSTPIVPGTAGLSAARWTCPDCGYDSMPYPPKDYHICPKCMVEFGNDDRKSTLSEREAKIRKSVLEEAAQLLKYCGYSANLVDEIRALAERPAPAGEVVMGEK